MDVMPKWAEVILVPLISLLLAAVLSALVILSIGEDPVAAVNLMVKGALGSTYGWGYTLYYATNFIFTGLPSPWLFTRGCSTSAVRVRRCWAASAWRWPRSTSRGRIGRWH